MKRTELVEGGTYYLRAELRDGPVVFVEYEPRTRKAVVRTERGVELLVALSSLHEVGA